MVAGVGNRRRVGRTQGVCSFMILLLAVLISSVSLSLLRRLGGDGVASFSSGSLDAGSGIPLDGNISPSPSDRSGLQGRGAMSWVVGFSICPPDMHLVGGDSFSAWN